MVDECTEEQLIEHLKSRLKAAMDETGLKGDRLAESIGVTKATTSKWAKKGQISHYNLYKLARLSKKPIGWFYPGFDQDDLTPAMDALLEDSRDDLESLESLLLDVLVARQRASKSE